MKSVDRIDELLGKARLVQSDPEPMKPDQKLFGGIDLGTSTIQFNIVDGSGEPVAGRSTREDAVRDGVVLDYRRAVEVLRDLVDGLIDDPAEIPVAVGYPPGTDSRAQRNAARDVGFEEVIEVSEPDAAVELLGLEDGVVVDIGGGTTGIAVIEGGERVSTTDIPTGGHHLTLVLSGNRDLDYEQAEQYKRSGDFDEFRGEVMPVIEKYVSIVEEHIGDTSADSTLVLVGGTCVPAGFEEPFAEQLDLTVQKPSEPLLVTPVGIAQTALAGG